MSCVGFVWFPLSDSQLGATSQIGTLSQFIAHVRRQIDSVNLRTMPVSRSLGSKTRSTPYAVGGGVNFGDQFLNSATELFTRRNGIHVDHDHLGVCRDGSCTLQLPTCHDALHMVSYDQSPATHSF